MSKRSEDEQLVKRAQKGEQAAFAEIYELYQPAVFRYVYYRVADVATAEDLTSTVFTRLVEKIDSYRHRGRPLLAWIYTIARNAVLDHHRRTSRSKLVPLDERLLDDSSDVELAVQRRLTKGRLAAAMSELTEDQRQVVMLRFIEGMSCKEVGRMLDKSTGAIKALQHRGLAALARILGPEGL